MKYLTKYSPSSFPLTWLLLLILGYYFQRPSLDIGFSLKPYMVVSVILLFYLYKDKASQLVFEPYDIVLIFYILWAGMTGLWAENPVASLRLLLGFLIVYSCYQIVKSYFHQYVKKPVMLEQAFVLASLIFVVISLGLYIAGYIRIGGAYSSYEHVRVLGVYVERGMPRLIGPLHDPNLFCLYVTPIFFYLITKSQKNILDLLFLSCVVCVVLLTMSRAGILAITIVSVGLVALSILERIKGYKKTIKSPNYVLIIGLIVVGVAFVGILLSLDMLPEIFVRRIATISSGSGRFEIWKNALDVWRTNPIFGVGLFNFLDINISWYNWPNYSHNTFLDVLVETGLVGFLIYCLFQLLVIFSLLRLYKNVKGLRFLLFAYLAILIQMNSLSIIVNEFYFLFLAFISFNINLKNVDRF